MLIGKKAKSLLIIVEGFDNSGKTSLINFIRENLNHNKYIVFGFKSSSQVKNHHKRLFQILSKANSSDTVLLCDRIGIIGEEVYGNVLRGFSNFDQGLAATWRVFLRSLHGAKTRTILIHCKPSAHTLGPKDEMEGVREHQDVLMEEYEEAMTRTHAIFDCMKNRGISCNFITFDYQTDPEYSTIKTALRRYMR